ncbi:restriction endonuclease subunit S [Lactobacillus reuteri]|uniref:restriction endonuclease subunit S n=1 Tax=Limosilactobacillus reuteri TaxID=1598 RepID=UPI00146DFAEF|nr:restriction endonuclease subunit S [Limosilactobacillus reuteri]NMV49267.1 restriction endonuclease subunit S [Limosilactobacillus reuteri]NMV50823.1 restriction endonuclease subunit S [Limosilactobacillus reuteri]NMV59739.1 restriction endonuclease subunit S [Limosilactobacillus reuteri]NMV61563.1 restriction endonuclease subunit S [Limosilactobacillus reuteri]NMV63299.1 restriction endonuclease subunit S [Limosilactobacillus reuteri]
MDKKPEKLVPEVRFKGFADDWEQRKLGEFYSFKNGLNKGKEYFGHGVPIVNYTDVYHHRSLELKDLKGKVELTSNEVKNNSAKTGDLFFTRTSETIDEIGFPAILLSASNDTVFSGFLIRVRPIGGDPLDLLFKKYVFYTKTFRQEMMRKSTITTRALTSGKNLSSMIMKFPDKIKEQNSIGNLLTKLDNLITLQQRKLEQLTQLKKALQQKLFSNSFQEKPLLRILHGDNSWWNSYIGEVFTERVDKGSSEKLLSVSITDGVYPFDESKRKNNSSNDKHNYKKVFQNDIAYNSMRLWQGALGVSNYEGIVSPAYTVLKPLANQNSIFYEFMFKNIDMLHIFQRNSQGLTSDTWNLKFNQLQHIKIKTTNLNSQNKIAKLLIKIEELKNDESNYYHNLMTLKKYLLQKLFI